MKAGHLALFHPEEGANVTFEGRKEAEELLDGVLLAGVRPVGQVRAGVGSFVTQDRWPKEEADKLRGRGFTLRKLRNPQFADDARHKPLVEALLNADGPVLEIAAGPSGGHFPLLLRHRQDADLLVNDISPGVLALWREALQTDHAGANTSLVAFDATAMPLREGSFGAVSAVLGFGSTRDCQKAVGEAYRVLQPGGVLCAVELVMTPATLEQLPADLRRLWQQRIPMTQQGVKGYLEQQAFVIESHRREYLRDGDPDEDPPAKLAAERGVTLRWDSEWVIARKPRA